MESMLPIAAFAERAQLSRRTIERKITIGEIGADYVQRPSPPPHHPPVSIQPAAASTIPRARRHVAFLAGGSGLPTDPSRAGPLVHKIKKAAASRICGLLL